MPFPPQVEQWRGLLRRLGPELPIDFMLAWLFKESGGNPCATGIPGVEAGIFQTFHPSDDRFGATFSQLRAACSGGSLTRPLTADEAELQARVGVNFLRGKIAAARGHFAAGGMRPSTSSADFWIGVKQEHALPCVMGEIPRVAARLGRPPRSWDEFRSQLMATPASGMGQGCANFANSPSLRGLRNRLEDTIHNAEEVGKFGGGFLGSGGGIVIKLALAAALAWGAYKIWTAGDAAPTPPTTT
jgi:hypothetical protein